MALPGVFSAFSAWLSVHALLRACHGQNVDTAPAGSPVLDDPWGPDRFPSAAAAPERARPAVFKGFPTLDDLVGPDDELPASPMAPQGDPRYPHGGRAWVKSPDFPLVGAEELGPEHYAPDLTELVLIAGHADRGDATFAQKGLRKSTVNYMAENLGWEQGLWMTHMEAPSDCYVDVAKTWRKGRECYAVWSATDDVLDGSSIPARYPPRTLRMCGIDIKEGVALTMRGFMESSEWPAFVEFFRDERCETVKSVGHSLGGGMAVLFAFCANARVDGFGERHDFGLVTFGGIPISTVPLYSGTPGTPFSGTRYHIAGPGDERPPWDPRAFRLGLLEVYGGVARAMGDAPAAHVLGEHARAIADLADDEVEPYWADKNVARQLAALHDGLANLRRIDSDDDLEYYGFHNATALHATRAYFEVFTKKVVVSGGAFYDYDPTSYFHMVFGYKHALVDFQPVSNKKNGMARMERVPAELATGLPHVDHWVSLLGQLPGHIPNHFICCYYRGSACVYHFKFSAFAWKACNAALFR